MPTKQANCLYCGQPFKFGWVRNKHMKLCVVLSVDTEHGAAEILDDHEVREADEMATEHE